MRNWITLFGPLNQTGYGTHFYNWARCMCHELTTSGINTVIVPRGQISRPELMKDGVDGFDALILDAIGLQDRMAFDCTSIMLWHQHDMSQFCGDPRIGYSVWETTGLTPRERHHLAGLDYIAVPTMWHRKILAEALPTRNPNSFLVWHEGVDPSYFYPSFQPKGFAAREAFTFLNIGKLEHRKGIHVLVQAFNALLQTRAVTERPLRLLCAWNNPFMAPDKWQHEVTRILKASSFGHPMPTTSVSSGGIVYVSQHQTHHDSTIEIHTHLPTKDSVRELYMAADAGVFPYFAEGWGLSVMEMMSMAKPVAATYWGAPLEYLVPRGSKGGTTLEEGTPLPAENIVYPITGEIAQAYDGVWFRGNKGEWCQVGVDSVMAAMHTILTASMQERQRIGQLASDHVRDNFSWKKAAEQTVSDLKDLKLID